MVGAPVVSSKSRTVDGERHWEALQTDVMNNLIKGALEKRRIDADDRTHALGGETRGEGDRMLLGNADVEEAIWIDRLELGKRRSGRHRRRDGDDPWIVSSEFDHRLSEDILVFWRRWWRPWHRRSRDGVPTLAVSRRPSEASSLFGHHVQEHGSRHQSGLPQGFDERAQVMPVDRSHIGESELLPDHRVIDELLERVLPTLAQLDEELALGQALRDAGKLVLGAMVARVGADAIQIAGHRADIRRDRHLVVVEDDEEGQIEDSRVVQGLEGHASSERAIAY